jgi:hypothetical protein
MTLWITWWLILPCHEGVESLSCPYFLLPDCNSDRVNPCYIDHCRPCWSRANPWRQTTMLLLTSHCAYDFFHLLKLWLNYWIYWHALLVLDLHRCCSKFSEYGNLLHFIFAVLWTLVVQRFPNIVTCCISFLQCFEVDTTGWEVEKWVRSYFYL